MILIDLDVEERSNLVRLLRRSLSARLGVRDRAEARAVGERGKGVQVPLGEVGSYTYLVSRRRPWLPRSPRSILGLEDE